MLRLIIVCVVGVCSAIVSHVASAAEANPKKERPEHLRYPGGHRYTPGRSYISLNVPTAMLENEWRRYARVLTLSEAQLAACAEMYDEYRKEDWAFRLKHLQPLWEQSGDLSMMGTVGTRVSSAQAFINLLKKSEPCISRLEAIDQKFLDRIVPILSEDQLERLDLVRHMRVRTQADAVRCLYPGTGFDIEAFLVDLENAGFDLTPTDPVRYRELMLAYRTSATSLFRQRSRLMRHGLYEGMLLSAQITEAETAGDMDLAAELREKHQQGHRNTLPVRKRIYNLNRQYITLLAEQLPKSAAERLVREFQTRTYSSVFPDPFNLDGVLDGVQLMSDLNEDQQEQIDSLVAAYKSQHNSINDEMILEYMRWQEYYVIRMGYEHDKYDLYRKQMVELQNKREASSREFLEQLAALLTPGQYETLAPEIERYKAAVKKHELMAADLAARQRAWPLP